MYCKGTAMYFYIIYHTLLLKVSFYTHRYYRDQTWTADLFTSTMLCPYTHNNGAVKNFFLKSSSLMSTTIYTTIYLFFNTSIYCLCLYAEAEAIVDNGKSRYYKLCFLV